MRMAKMLKWGIMILGQIAKMGDIANRGKFSKMWKT